MRVLIVDDHALVRNGVKGIVGEQLGDVTFGEASTPQGALELVRAETWDAVLLDISLGGRNGLELLQELKQIRPALPVLILSMHSEEQYARRAFKSGAAGYVIKDSSHAELVTAIKRVSEGGRYVSPALTEELEVDIDRATDRPLHDVLSDRECEVMRLIASGKTLGEVAEILTLSDHTVSTYRARLLEKMGMRTDTELIYYALHN